MLGEKNILFSLGSSTVISFPVVPGALAKSNTGLDTLPSITRSHHLVLPVSSTLCALNTAEFLKMKI